MKYYAQLNENNICVGVSQLSGKVEDDKMVEIQSFDGTLIWKKYDSELKEWSTESFEPASTAPIDEFEQLKLDNQNLKTEVDNMKIKEVKDEKDKIAMQQAIDDLIFGGVM